MLKLLNDNARLRDPGPSGQGKNGFAEAPKDPTRPLLLPTGHKGEDGESEVVSISDDALHRYRQAMHILTQKDRPIPT
ncbi:hypothetical protein APHAL10511_001664 [Amanita phalloides]|nr:hypothetical protein APHAL10511_001664 [Amanita phalloides]